MADIVIVGAGPQALTLSCLLLQKRPRLQRRLWIVDPSGRWLSRWQWQMDQYEIPWLQSPSPHHPYPNAHVLRRFAHRQQRHQQLEGAYGLPHTDLFAAFCREVISEFALELSLSDGTTVQAGRAVIASGNDCGLVWAGRGSTACVWGEPWMPLLGVMSDAGWTFHQRLR